MPSARKSGINEQIKTFGAVGFSRDYTSINTWESDTDTNHVSDSETDVLECYDDSASFSVANVTIGGSNNNESYHRRIRPASGQKHNGTPNDGFNIDSGINGIVFVIEETYVAFEDIVITFSINSAGNRFPFDFQPGAGNSSLVGCIAYDCSNSGSGTAGGFRVAEGNIYLILCLAADTDSDGFAIDNSCTVYNCTCYSNGDAGIDVSSGTVVCKNVLSANNIIDFEGTITGNNNASSDTTAPGTSSRIDQTFTFINTAGDDWHLAIEDVGAKNYGADLSSDGTFAFNDDIDGDIFSTWDIGFDETGDETGNPDTREKRASVVNFLLCNYGQGVTPQASFPQSERQAVLWTYAGILAASTAEDYIANFILLSVITQMRAGRA